MLRLLLDECMDPRVVAAVLSLEPDCPIISLQLGEGAQYRGLPDPELLAAVRRDGLTLVSRDGSSIPKHLTDLYFGGQVHAGVIIVPERSFPRRDIGLLARSLVQLWQAERSADWTNRCVYLSAAG